MKIIELFSGTESFSNVARDLGHEVFTVEKDCLFNPSLCADILTDKITFPYKPDIVWASPPCQGFSVAAIGKNWDKDTGLPKTDSARLGLKLLEKTVEIIKSLDPKYFFIENPRGKMRKMDIVQQFQRRTVTYCQYGDTRMKPTDIFHNHDGWISRPPCKNGAPCHISAPRGSRTGTQGIKGAKDRSRVPYKLCEEILMSCRKALQGEEGA